MAAATPTTYTDKIVKTDEVAEFSPEIIAEMNMHVAKYPADRTRSALIPLLMLVQRERGHRRLGDRDVLLDVQSPSGGSASHSDLQDALVPDHG
jgi:hypothetical protein